MNSMEQNERDLLKRYEMALEAILTLDHYLGIDKAQKIAKRALQTDLDSKKD